MLVSTIGAISTAKDHRLPVDSASTGLSNVGQDASSNLCANAVGSGGAMT